MFPSDFTLAAGKVFDPTFETPVGSIPAGTAFALRVPERAGAMLVTCQHLFGPAGGMAKDVQPHLMSRFATAVSAVDIASGARVRGGAAIVLPGAAAYEPLRDIAAFGLPATAAVAPLAIGDAPMRGGRVMLAARLRSGTSPATLHPARYVGEAASGVAVITFDDPDIALTGTAGAPVINMAGDLVGMVVRFQASATAMLACLVPAAHIRALLAEPCADQIRLTANASRVH